METLGGRLKILRGSISQAALADRLGIPQTTWSNYEKDKNKPDFALIDQLCIEFKVSADWLLFGRESAPENFENSSLVTSPHEEKRIEALENERRELSTENRQLYREKTELLKEIADLRERVARLEEQAKTSNNDLKQGFTNPTVPASVPSVRSIAHTSD
ncbi:helix-turn-helix domain-containing protein [Desulfovibrio sp. QI0434]